MKYDNVTDIEVTRDSAAAKEHIRKGFSTIDVRTEKNSDGTERTVFILLKTKKGEKTKK